jgi:hypothetical protein
LQKRWASSGVGDYKDFFVDFEKACERRKLRTLLPIFDKSFPLKKTVVTGRGIVAFSTASNRENFHLGLGARIQY